MFHLYSVDLTRQQEGFLWLDAGQNVIHPMLHPCRGPHTTEQRTPVVHSKGSLDVGDLCLFMPGRIATCFQWSTASVSRA